MNETLIVVVLLWLSIMARNGSFSAILPIAYRVQASILTLYLIWAGFLSTRFLGWSVFHPQWFLTRYWQSAGLFPAGISIAIVGVSLLASSLGLYIGVQICQRRLQGFNWAVRCAPYLLLVSLLDFIRIFTAPRVKNHAIGTQSLSSHDLFVRNVGTHVLRNHSDDARTFASPDVLAIAFVVIALFTIAFYFWLYRFAKNPKNRQFIKNDGIGVSQSTT